MIIGLGLPQKAFLSYFCYKLLFATLGVLYNYYLAKYKNNSFQLIWI